MNTNKPLLPIALKSITGYTTIVYKGMVFVDYNGVGKELFDNNNAWQDIQQLSDIVDSINDALAGKCELSIEEATKRINTFQPLRFGNKKTYTRFISHFAEHYDINEHMPLIEIALAGSNRKIDMAITILETTKLDTPAHKKVKDFFNTCLNELKQNKAVYAYTYAKHLYKNYGLDALKNSGMYEVILNCANSEVKASIAYSFCCNILNIKEMANVIVNCGSAEWAYHYMKDLAKTADDDVANKMLNTVIKSGNAVFAKKYYDDIKKDERLKNLFTQIPA